MKLQLIANIKLAQNAEAGVSLGYLFAPGAEVTVGREIGNTIAPLVDSLSRHHAKLYSKDGDWYVEDLGSTNGSFLNGEKLATATKLASGMKLQFGTMTVAVDLVEDKGATAPLGAAASGAAPLMTPAEAATAAAAAGVSAESAPTIVRRPTIPGITPPAAAAAPVLPKAVTPPAPAPAPAPAVKPAPAPAPAAAPAADVKMEPVDDIPDLPAVEPAPAPAAPAAAPAAAKPAAAPAAAPKAPIRFGAAKPAFGAGLKLPPKPGTLGPGLKLPPKPGPLGAGIKLPPKKPALGPGLKLPPK